MNEEFKKNLDGSNLSIGIVVAEYNNFITSKLLDSTKETLISNNVDSNNILVLEVAGAFEIPVVASKLAKSKKFDAIICLGAVIKGETDHYEYVSLAVTQGIARIAIDNDIPVIFGVLTTHNVEQALDRVGGKKGNEGEDYAVAALKAIYSINQII
ncbi:MAG: 6,7-dimethyl-8-ribityllumazine synthase [Dehalococcoidia bacterium]|tara:strand:- start:614 stop:1081 length:468 start_codon:yes stop_codon:yes gene_type:complete